MFLYLYFCICTWQFPIIGAIRQIAVCQIQTVFRLYQHTAVAPNPFKLTTFKWKQPQFTFAQIFKLKSFHSYLLTLLVLAFQHIFKLLWNALVMFVKTDFLGFLSTLASTHIQHIFRPGDVFQNSFANRKELSLWFVCLLTLFVLLARYFSWDFFQL